MHLWAPYAGPILGLILTGAALGGVRQSGPIADQAFAIECLDPGVQAVAFTFG